MGKGGPKGVPEAKIIEALEASGGICSEAAKAVGVTRQALAERVRKNPNLLAAALEAREALLDECESVLLAKVREGDEKTARWLLATFGRSRGYGVQSEMNWGEKAAGRVGVADPVTERMYREPPGFR